MLPPPPKKKKNGLSSSESMRICKILNRAHATVRVDRTAVRARENLNSLALCMTETIQSFKSRYDQLRPLYIIVSV